MNKVVVCGLCRAGTTSLNEALTILGYNTLHICELTNPSKFKTNLMFEQYDSIVNWKLTEQYKSFPSILPADYKHIIICERSQGWENSMKQFGFSQEEIEKLFFQKEKAYLYLRERYTVMKFNISEHHGFLQLCNFLRVGKVPTQPFPHSNRSPLNYEI